MPAVWILKKLYCYIPLTSILICYRSGFQVWGINNVDSMVYVSRACALVSLLAAGKFWGYREMHWVWVFSSVIPPLDGDGGRSVVNIYIYAFMHFQVGCIRIRSLNTSQSDEMVERNRATFPRMEEYIFIFYFYFFVQVVSWWWCCFSACYQCEHPGAFHVTFVSHNTKLPFEFSQAPGWC